MKKLTTKQVISLHKSLLPPPSSLRSEAPSLRSEAHSSHPSLRSEPLLDSAVNAPLQTFGGEALYASVLEKAARLGYGLIKNHPFVDGNKRVGAHAMLVFLDVNLVELDYTDAELVQIIMAVASGIEGEGGLLAWLRSHVRDKG